jgi:hypothetical protein
MEIYSEKIQYLQMGIATRVRKVTAISQSQHAMCESEKVR